MEERGALSCHRIFVSSGKVECGLASFSAEWMIDRHERVIAVDHDPGTFGPCDRGQFRNAVEDATASKHDLADQDEVVVTPRGSFEEPVREILGRLRRNRIEHDPAGLGPTCELPACTVELAVAGQNSKWT